MSTQTQTQTSTIPNNGYIPNIPYSFLLTESVSDEGNAQALNKLYPDKFLNCVELGKQGKPGWMFYNHRFWEIGQANEILDRFAVDMLIKRHEMAVAQGVDPNTQKLIHDNLVSFSTPSAYRVKGTKDLFKSIVRASIAEFDNSPDLLNCRNGVVNLKTGVLAPHDPLQRFTYCLDVDYKPNADYSFWENWLQDVVGKDTEMVKYLQRIVGYSLSGHTNEECLFYVHGPTRGGKGVFSQTLQRLLSEPLSTGVDFATFTEKRDGDSQNFDLAGLKATRFIVASESNKSQVLNPRRIKTATGGDAIRCAHKHGDFFTYWPQFKIWLFSNEPLRADFEDDAIWARVNVIEFPNSYLGKEDKTLKEKMVNPTNLEGILAWAVIGSQSWYANGLQRPDKVKDFTKKHREMNDFSQRFMDDCLTATKSFSDFLPNAVLKTVYKNWCEANNFLHKEKKMMDKLSSLYTPDKNYIDNDFLKFTGYDKVIKFPDDDKYREQHRGYRGLVIEESILNEYL